MPTLNVAPWFWNLLENFERNLDHLARKLEALSQDDLRDFQAQYEAAKIQVNPGIPGAMEGVEAAGLDQECSEDGGEDFADWIVSQGHLFYEHVRTQPALINEYLALFLRHEHDRQSPETAWDDAVTNEEYQGYQIPGLIAYGVYARRFDSSLFDDLDTFRAPPDLDTQV